LAYTMFSWRASVVSALLLAALEPVRASQEPLVDITKRRQLHGRFLQVTGKC
jgi:heme exporter protein D